MRGASPEPEWWTRVVAPPSGGTFNTLASGPEHAGFSRGLPMYSTCLQSSQSVPSQGQRAYTTLGRGFRLRCACGYTARVRILRGRGEAGSKVGAGADGTESALACRGPGAAVVAPSIICPTAGEVPRQCGRRRRRRRGGGSINPISGVPHITRRLRGNGCPNVQRASAAAGSHAPLPVVLYRQRVGRSVGEARALGVALASLPALLHRVEAAAVEAAVPWVAAAVPWVAAAKVSAVSNTQSN